MPEPDRCPSSPAGESHRWRLPDQGERGPAVCRYCGAARVFPTNPETTRWERMHAKAGGGAARRARQAKAAE